MASAPTPHEERIGLLRDHDLKVTTQRLAILEALMDGPRHPTAEEVHEALGDAHPTVSLSTVYDTLARFGDLGIVDPFHIGDGVTRYEFHNTPHVNFVCVECQEILDVETPKIQALARDVEERTGYRVRDEQIELRGVCDACRA